MLPSNDTAAPIKKPFLKVVPLTYSFRLPDALQPDALSLLNMAKTEINALLTKLWPHLGEFAKTNTNARAQIEAAFPKPAHLESRQYRGIAETTGRILRSQADRLKIFNLIQPILSTEMVVPARKDKNRKLIREAVSSLKAALAGDGENAVYLQNVVEQACNVFLAKGEFPATFFEMQPLPILKLGQFTYAADDGGEKGSMYRYGIQDGQLSLKLKVPGANGKLIWSQALKVTLPPSLQETVKEPERLCAPTLREVEDAAGSHYAVLDIILERRELAEPTWAHRRNILSFDWGVRNLLTIVALDASGEQLSRPFFMNTGGFDGRQARLRRQIDQLKSQRDRLKHLSSSAQRTQKIAELEREISICWAAYERRNEALAHLCSNVLLVLAAGYGCHAIAGEWLGSLRSLGHGKYTRSRWRNWRNNTTVRSAITNKLKYKCRLRGVKLRLENPRGTSHHCPRCGEAADTYRSPSHREVVDWGGWLKCSACGWNGSRDYAGALNIGRLAAAFYDKLAAAKAAGEVTRKTYAGYRVESIKHKPASYIGAGAALPIPPQGTQQKTLFFCSYKDVDKQAPRFSYSGWDKMVSIYPKFQVGRVVPHRFACRKRTACLCLPNT